MAETVNKLKLQLRSVASFNGKKSPTPATKLLINHGKPNFTLPHTAKDDKNGGGPLSLTAVDSNNNYNPYRSANSSLNCNDFVVKSTKFNGIFKPVNVDVTDQSTANNESSKVVLRRLKVPELIKKEGEDDSVPEFILRQRRIQERLAKDNVLDFERRRSGYFTHVLISPTSMNRTSFVETMSSPAVVPALEVPPSAKREKSVAEEEELGKSSTNDDSNAYAYNTELEEQEVENAIEEVNKAVAGEEESDVVHEHLIEEEAHKIEQKLDTAEAGECESKVRESPIEETKAEEVKEEHVLKVAEESIVKQQAYKVEEPVVSDATTKPHIEEPQTKAKETPVRAAEESTKQHKKKLAEVTESTIRVATVGSIAAEIEESVQSGHEGPAAQVQNNGHVEVVVTEIKKNVHEAQNGLDTSALETISIFHTNSSAGPAPDPSGSLGVNYKPKTVVSFSKNLGSASNKYPDSVQVVKEETKFHEDLQDVAKLQFKIKTDEQDV